MDNRISILFHLKRSKKTTEGLLPIYMRVTIDGTRFETSTHRYVEESKWGVAAGKVKENSEEARTINNYLDVLKARVYQYQKDLIQEGKACTVETFREKWSGKGPRPRMLMEIFKQHNEQMKALVGGEFAPATLERYKTSFDHTRSFLKWKFDLWDMDIKKLDFEFVMEYEFWLKSVRKCNHNSAIKYIGNFRKIVNRCVRNSWLSRDPFAGFKMTKREVVRDFLSEEELDRIANKRFASERLALSRDLYHAIKAPCRNRRLTKTNCL